MDLAQLAGLDAIRITTLNAVSSVRRLFRCLRQRPSVSAPSTSRSLKADEVSPEIIFSCARSSTSAGCAAR